jgi:predicted O-linked N-acetylglucosamine transferase (SPINDLY family)
MEDRKEPRTTDSLIRLGEYKKAAKEAILLYKAGLAFDYSLPYSLLKAGRHRLATKLAIALLIKDASELSSSAMIAADCLKNFSPSTKDIQEAADFLPDKSIRPEILATAVSGIPDISVAEATVQILSDRQQFSNRDVSLTNAYLSKAKGNITNALSIAQSLVLEDPNDAEAAKLAAEILNEHNYTYASRRFSCLALKHNRRDIRALQNLALSMFKESRWKSARTLFRLLHIETNDDISLLNSLIILPPLIHASNDLPQAIKGFASLESLLKNPPKLIGIAKSLELSIPLPSEFYLAYEGTASVRRNLENVRNFVRLSAQDLLAEIRGHYKVPIKANLGADSPRLEKIKIAFISRYFSNHSNLVAHYGLISKLDRARFEVVLIHRTGVITDSKHHDVNKLADEVIYLPSHFGESCKLIHQLKLDILFFTDIGMGALDSILAMPHLANHQITSWGLPHTTGVKEIDIHARSSIFRDCEGQAEYTEKLVSVKGYIGYFTYDKNELVNKSRDYFLLPPDRFLVGCLQAIHKIHPEFDSYLNEIAKIDESILILIVPSEQDRQMEGFVRRLKQSAPIAYQQLCILQRTTPADFYSLNAILDLNLDTIYYGAGVTFVQTAWCGAPYITQQSNLVKSSVVSRSYRYMGITNAPIALNRQSYVDMVKYYFDHRDELRMLREEIQAKSEGTIYNNDDYIQGYENLFTELARGHSAVLKQ